MKKFIAAFDGLNFSESTLNYAVYLAKNCSAHLVGVFLEDVTRHSYSVADVVSYEGEAFDQHIHALDMEDKEKRNESVQLFEKACQNASLNYTIHRDKNIALHELLHESIYADLLIINAGETITRYNEPLPTRFVRELLIDIQCPVLLVPAKYKPIEKVVLLYDGSPSSVFAVRTFTYLFDSMKETETEIISVKPADETQHLPDNRLVKEYIKRHFPKADYTILKGYAEDEIIKYLHLQKSEPMVVLGAYRRSRLSRLFKPSMADYLLQHVKMPLFIAHNKS